MAKPIRGQDEIHLPKKVGNIESLWFKFRISALLGYPKVHIFVFGLQPRERENSVHVVCGGETGGAFTIPEGQSSSANQGDFGTIG